MVMYSGPDKLIGVLLGTIGPTLVYWENVKAMDVQRYVNSVVLSINSEDQTYEGFGWESFKDVEVNATIFMSENTPLGLSDENTLEQYLQQVHTIINQYDNSDQADTVVGNPVVWVKITDEKREDDVRGIILYEVTFQVRVYIPRATPVAVTPTTTGLMQLMMNFLAGVPGFSEYPFSEVKSLDIQRTGDILVVHAPAISGHVMGLGEGQKFGQYQQQQISNYIFKITLYALAETDIVTATDWIASQSVLYFLNTSFGNGITVLSKMQSFGQILNERGIWLRELEIMVEAIVG